MKTVWKQVLGHRSANQAGLVLFLILMSVGCASRPKVSELPVEQQEARAWFQKYCARPAAGGLQGEMVLRSKTPEFTGQFPASVRFEPQGAFQLEVTNIIGGTVAQLKGDGKTLSVRVPGKPKLNRSGITHYLGLDVPVLVPLLRGELPCPQGWEDVEVLQNAMVIKTKTWEWRFYRSAPDSGAVPAKIELIASGVQIDLQVEEWNEAERYLRKGHVRSPEGELRWTWRSRGLLQ